MSLDLTRASDVPSLPRIAATTSPIEGQIREQFSDFRVEEMPAYEPSGVGDHLYVQFEKTDLGTPEAVKRIARALEVSPRDAGYAGLKDRRAVTTQWASFLFGDAAKLEGASIDGVRVLAMARHGNKLRTGHLHGNRFVILVRGAPTDRADDARAVLEVLTTRGTPNYFGAQRFGRDGSNLHAAARWLLEGGRAPRKPFERKLFVSTLQSAMFNELLAARVTEGTMDAVVEGDLLRKEESGGMYVSDDLEVDLERVRAREVSPTGPMFGAKMRWPEREAERREREALARWGLDQEAMQRFRRSGEGTRRPYRVLPSAASVSARSDGLELAFTLPSGAYATVVLREVLGRAVS